MRDYHGKLFFGAVLRLHTRNIDTAKDITGHDRAKKRDSILFGGTSKIQVVYAAWLLQR